jgi:hypothetical protein
MPPNGLVDRRYIACNGPIALAILLAKCVKGRAGFTFSVDRYCWATGAVDFSRSWIALR